MKVIFCGTYMPLELARKLKYSSEAALKFQRNLLHEFKKENSVEVLSYIPYNDEIINSLEENNIVEEVTVNYIKKIDHKNYFNLLIAYFKRLNLLLKNKEAVLLYNYNYINLFTVYLAKRNKVKAFLILADHDNYKSQKNILKKILIKLYEHNIKKFDGVIFLSDFLSKEIYTKNKLKIEGGIQIDKYLNLSKPTIKDSTIKIMYSGSLEKVSGIDMYIEAIKKINLTNIEFVFTGKGDLVDQIIAQSDSRIKYKGMVSEKEYYKLLEEANILVNSKNMNLLENKNNFPSKILEYIASGRTIISTKFSGKEKFDENIVFTESNSSDLACNIINVVNNYERSYMDYYKLNINKANEFTWQKQVKKINNFIKSI